MKITIKIYSFMCSVPHNDQIFIMTLFNLLKVYFLLKSFRLKWDKNCGQFFIGETTGDSGFFLTAT